MTLTKMLVTGLTTFTLLIATPLTAGNLLTNGGFETGDFTDWIVGQPTNVVATPGVGANQGSFAAELKGTDEAQVGVYTIRQSFLANPGDEFSFSGFMLSENGIPGDGFGILKIIFRDAQGVDLEPESASVGFLNDTGFPGIEGMPSLNLNSDANSWIYTESQGIAPAGTTEVQFIALNVDVNNGVTGTTPIWFDDIEVAIFPSDYTELQIVKAEALVEALNLSQVTTEGNQNAFGNFLAKAIRELKKGHPDKALKKIEQAIGKTDGCFNNGSPDGKGKSHDWITDCYVQAELYQRLTVARDHLQE